MELALLTSPQTYISLVTLTALEIVLGIDNIVFISILASKLPAAQQNKARQLGLSLALITRILLLLSLSWVMGLTAPLFTLWGHGASGRDLILILGGMFLIWKSTTEIHEKLMGEDGEVSQRIAPTFTSVIIQILLLDIVFSLDSVITAVGMVKEIAIMITAVVIAVIFPMPWKSIPPAYMRPPSKSNIPSPPRTKSHGPVTWNSPRFGSTRVTVRGCPYRLWIVNE